VHEDFPRQAAVTTAVLLAALQAPFAHLLQILSKPLGVPYDANTTAVIVAPASSQRSVSLLLGKGGLPPFAQTPQKGGPSAALQCPVTSSRATNFIRVRGCVCLCINTDAFRLNRCMSYGKQPAVDGI
jgi:hypothetical protein